MGLAELANKHKNRIINVVIIILALIISGNIYKKQAEAIKSLEEQKEVEIKKNGVIKDINQLHYKINAYKNLLIRKDASSVINNISDMAKHSGVTIISIRPDSEQKYPNYSKLPFGLLVSAADYHAIGRFISALEDYQDVYVVEAISIKPERQTGGLGINLRLSSVAFIK